MAIIYTYKTKALPSLTDLLIISDTADKKKTKKKKIDLQKQWTEIKQKMDNLVQDMELMNMETIAHHAREIDKLCNPRNEKMIRTHGRYHKKKGQNKKNTWKKEELCKLYDQILHRKH